MSSLFFTAPSATSEGLGANLGVQSATTSTSLSPDQEIGDFSDILSVAMDQSQSADSTSPPIATLSDPLPSTTDSLSSAPISLDFQPYANQLSLLLNTSTVSQDAAQPSKMTGFSFSNQWQLEQPLVSNLPMAEQISTLANWLENFSVRNNQTGQLLNTGKVGQILPKIVKSIQANLTDVESAQLNIQVNDQQLTLKLNQTEIQLPLSMSQELDFDPQLVAQLLTTNSKTLSEKNGWNTEDLLTATQVAESDDFDSTDNEIEQVGQFGHPSLMVSQNLGIASSIRTTAVPNNESSLQKRAEIFSTLPSTQMAFRFESGRVYLRTDQADLSTIQTKDGWNQLGSSQLMTTEAEINEVEITATTESILIDRINQLNNVGTNSLSENDVQQAANQIQRLAAGLVQHSARQMPAQTLLVSTAPESVPTSQLNVVFGFDSDKLTIGVPGSVAQFSVPTATDLPITPLTDWIEKVSIESEDPIIEKSRTVSIASSPAINFGLNLSTSEIETLPINSPTADQIGATQQMLGHLAVAMEQSITQSSNGLLQVSIPNGIEQVAMRARLQVEANDSSVRLTFQSQNPTVLTSLQRSLQGSLQTSSVQPFSLIGQQQSTANSTGLEPSVESILNRLNVSAMHMTNYGDNTVPEPNSVSFIPNGVTVDGSADISNIGLKQTESVATSTQVSSPTVETILSGRSKQLGISANLSNSNSIGQQTFVEAEVDDSTNWQDTTKLPFVDMEIDPARGNRSGTQSDQVSNMLLGGSHASVVPMPTVNGSKKAIEPTLLTGTAIDHQIDNSILGQSFNSETAFSQSDDNSSSLMESELASTESDSFTTVLEQENETQRMEFLSTAPQRQLNETGGVSLQDEVSSQFAEVRRVREARQDIIREIQSLQNDHRQESEREMTIQLQPARLGRLMVRVSQRRDLDGNSAVAVQIQASSTEAQQLLMNELSDLRSDFQTQGIDLTGLDVSIDSGRNFHQSRSQGLFFADYQRQMRSGGNIRPADPVNSSIQRSTSNRARVGTQYANNQLNLVI